MIDTYRQKGAAPRLLAHAARARAMPTGSAIGRSRERRDLRRGRALPRQVRVLDMNEIFTPGYSYRDAMEVDGREQIVRESDGIHLNGVGVKPAADAVLNALRRDFKL